MTTTNRSKLKLCAADSQKEIVLNGIRCLSRITFSNRGQVGVMEEWSDHRFVILGSTGSGKSTLSIQWINNHFIDEYDPRIEDSYRKQIDVDGKTGLLEFLDTACQYGSTCDHQDYFSTSRTILLVFAINNRRSFDEIANFYFYSVRELGGRDVSFLLVGNKIDLESERQVPTEEAEELAAELKAFEYMEVTCKTRSVDEILHVIVRNQRELYPEVSKRTWTHKKKCVVM